MYPVPDDDLELLESYLDDALSDPQIDALRGRLAVEPAMAAALRLLRDERQQREAFFQSIEPTPAHVDSLIRCVHERIERKVHWTERMKFVRVGSALAACLVVGLASGLMFRSTPQHGDVSPMQAEQIYDPNEAAFPVPLTDQAGNVIAVQHFKNATDASNFADDLQKVQAEHSGGSRTNSNDF